MKSGGNTRRIFLAIPVPAEVVSLQNDLRLQNNDLTKVKWMRNHNLHLTVYFIGNIPSEQFQDTIELITPVIIEQTAFTLKFGLLYFAPSGKPEMLWAKYEKNNAFSFFAESIHNAISKSIPNTDLFRKEPIPHITLARFHTLKNHHEIKTLQDVSLPDMAVSSCELWESVKEEGRSEYKSILRFNFK